MVARIVRFAIVAVLAGFTGLVLHEVLGHALPSWIFGARGLRITLNYDFTGSVSGGIHGEELARWQQLVVDSGGIVVNLITGLAALPLAERVERGRSRRAEREWLRLFLVLFGGISVFKALEYATMSFFYGGPGDPMQHTSVCTIWHATYLWALPLAAVPFAAFAFGRAYARLCEPTLKSACVAAAPTLVLGAAFYYRHALLAMGRAPSFAATRSLERISEYCHIEASALNPPFAMLPIVLFLASTGALAGVWLTYTRTRAVEFGVARQAR